MTKNEAIVIEQWFNTHYPEWTVNVKNDFAGYSVNAYNKGNSQDKLSIAFSTSNEWLQKMPGADKLNVNVYCNYQLILNVRGRLVTETLESIVSYFKALATAMLPKGSLVATQQDFKKLTPC